MRAIDITGNKYGRLKVISLDDPYISKSGKKKRMWKVVCDCGNVKIAYQDHLTRGRVKSCGCIPVKNARELNRTHGMSKKPEYSIWLGIKKRCNNKNSEGYKYYGKRGI